MIKLRYAFSSLLLVTAVTAVTGLGCGDGETTTSGGSTGTVDLGPTVLSTSPADASSGFEPGACCSTSACPAMHSRPSPT